MLLPWWPRAIGLGPKGEPRVKKEWLYNDPAGLIIGINTLGELAHWFVVEDAAARFYEQPDTRRHKAAGARGVVEVTGCLVGRQEAERPSDTHSMFVTFSVSCSNGPGAIGRMRFTCNSPFRPSARSVT
jgi:hypothetical protein